jgi:membrane protein implicated in regulation of membrane protease activity
MIFQYIALAAFATGSVLGVFQVFFGVERRGRRRRGARGRPVAAADPAARERETSVIPASLVQAQREISARISLPSVAAFLTFFGLCGYLTSRFTRLSTPVCLILASIAGGLGIVGVLALIKAWAVPSARREVVDERFVLMGHLARVTKAIGESEPGEIVYEVDGIRYTAEALSLDGETVGEGTEVVIERVEGRRAYVEAWAHVEKRL